MDEMGVYVWGRLELGFEVSNRYHALDALDVNILMLFINMLIVTILLMLLINILLLMLFTCVFSVSLQSLRHLMGLCNFILFYLTRRNIHLFHINFVIFISHS